MMADQVLGRVLILAGLATLLVLVSACGLRDVPNDPPTAAEIEVNEQVDRAQGIWLDAVQSWEEAAKRDDPGWLEVQAFEAAASMGMAIRVLDNIEADPDTEEFLDRLREAMDYERRGFLALEEYYQLGYKRPFSQARADELNALVIELAKWKDAALFAARGAHNR